MANGVGADLNVIDQFMTTFTQYIDSGFGLLGPDVGFLTTVLIGIDITISGLWWAMDGDSDILGRLLRKVLYVGAFALILNNFQHFSEIIFQSFAGLGLHASATSLTAADLMKPGKLAGVGFTAAWPLLQQANSAVGLSLSSLATAAILLIAWLIVVLAFFILAVQLFITILEFKLTSLAGFTLVPFALWNKTSFLAERVLGNVISSGIKVMVLAVIVGIGSSFFSDFTSALQGQTPDTGHAMSLVLASLALLGLGIFGPAIAAGLVSGAPQLGAGAAVGTVAGAAIATGGAAFIGARAAMAAASGGMAAIRAGTAMGSAASATYRLGQETSGSTGVGAGLGGIATAAGGATRNAARSAAERFTGPICASAEAGQDAAWRAGSRRAAPSPAGPANAPAGAGANTTASAPDGAPGWARKLRAEQAARQHRHTAIQTVKEGDRPGAPANPDLSSKED
jgi:type IV secretion system protein TrbL